MTKTDGTIRILCIGASTTQQPIQNTEDIWSALLEKNLQQAFALKDVRIEVATYGSGGHTAYI